MKRIVLLLLVFYPFASASLSAQGSTELAPEGEKDEFTQFRLGGYGEMAASYMDYDFNRFTPTGAAKSNRGSVSIPRFIVALDYKFSSTWLLGAEIEFEYGGTGIAREIEWADEGGEYEVEIEKGGEVALEQFHITKLIHKSFNIRMGHLIVPVGLTNARHEPINFFGVYRPEGETTILPSTWHENGIAFFGKVYAFDYEVQMVAGLDPNGFRNKDWIANGKQNAFEVNSFTSPAFVGRVNYSGVKGLRLGGSIYYNKTAKNASKPSKTAKIDAPVLIFTADAQYKSKHIIARANMVYGDLDDSKQLSAINRRSSASSGYPHTDVARNAVSYAAEAGYNVGSFWGDKAPRIFPFVRYEYYNPMERTIKPILADKRFQTSMWTVGLNYYALPNLVVKADYSRRIIGGGKYNDENMLSAGVAYIGWFFQK
jgi:hypothetical protein